MESGVKSDLFFCRLGDMVVTSQMLTRHDTSFPLRGNETRNAMTTVSWRGELVDGGHVAVRVAITLM